MVFDWSDALASRAAYIHAMNERHRHRVISSQDRCRIDESEEEFQPFKFRLESKL